MPALVIIAVATLVLGMAIIVLGIVRLITSRRQMRALRRAVATGVTGSGIAAFGLALLIIGKGSGDVVGLTAGAVVGIVGVGQLLIAAVIRRRSQ